MSECEFKYHRVGKVVEIKVKGVTNHELRAILVGFWLTLDEDDREDFIGELVHYLTFEGSFPPPLSEKIAKNVLDARKSGVN